MILGINEKDMLDADKVKIIDSIAGAGKSSQIDSFLKSNGVKYLRCTSTNTLKKDAIERFGGEVKTICAALFDNTEGFRSTEKEIEGFDTIVLDEILQDGWQALQWVERRIGSGLNIILTTDSRQMLAPECAEKVQQIFERLKNNPGVIVSQVNTTLRGVNEETREEVKRLYNSDAKYYGSDIMKQYMTINIEDVTFSNDCVYLCHTNEIEHYLYKTFDLSNAELIGKGRCSGKEPVRGKYPTADEITAKTKRMLNYYQACNIATPTRYQGSEVLPGQTGYYFIESNSYVNARELYTVVSRFKDIANLRIVNCDGMEKRPKIEEFQGKKVKEMSYLFLDKFDGKTHIVKEEELAKIIAEHKSEKYYYSLEWVYAIEGDTMFVQYVNERHLKKCQTCHDYIIGRGIYCKDLKTKPGAMKKSLAASLSKKDMSIQYDYMPEVYNKIGVTFKGAMLTTSKEDRSREWEKQCDLFSAYGTVANNTKMPIAGKIYDKYDENKLNWYICNSRELMGINNLITEDLAEALGMNECRYVFTTDYSIGNAVSKYVYETARKSKEDKKKISAIHWGYFEKKFIEMHETAVTDGGGNVTVERMPVQMSKQIHELFLYAIKSHLACIMYKARESVGGGRVLTDALYYDGDEKPELPEWADYRICTGSKNEGEYEGIIEQSYELKSKAEVEKEKARERQRKRRANMTEEQKEEMRRKDREHKASAKA